MCQRDVTSREKVGTVEPTRERKGRERDTKSPGVVDTLSVEGPGGPEE